MNNLIDYIIKQLAGENNYDIEIVEQGDTYVIDINVEKDKIAKVIGKFGKTAKAIRVLVKSSIDDSSKKCEVNINER